MNLTGVMRIRRGRYGRWAVAAAGVLALAVAGGGPRVLQADTTPLTMLDPNLEVTTVVGPAADSRSRSGSSS